MKVIYLLRSHELWHKRYEYTETWQDRWNVLKVADAWDSVFNLTYREFKMILNYIREENYKDLKFDAKMCEYELTPDNMNGLIVPTDDDDWFRSDITSILREHLDDHIVYRWNFIEWSQGIITQYIPPWECLTFDYQSNNYALLCPTDPNLATSHGVADSELRGKEKLIMEGLSLHNRTIASLSLLQHYKDNLRPTLRYFYDVYREEPNRTTIVPEYFEKFIDMMMNVYRNVLQPKQLFF